MAKEIELEKTYLLKYLPEDIEENQAIEIFDVYIPKSADHSILRIRKRGDLSSTRRTQDLFICWIRKNR